MQICQGFQADNYVSADRRVPLHIDVEPVAARYVLDFKFSTAVRPGRVQGFVVPVESHSGIRNGIALCVYENASKVRQMVGTGHLNLRMRRCRRRQNQRCDRQDYLNVISAWHWFLFSYLFDGHGARLQ